MFTRPYDILCTGELLADLISTDFEDSLESADLFRRLPGGSPANLCMNMARLGNRALLAATVGEDETGQFLKKFVSDLGIDTQLIREVNIPTSLVLVTRSREVSDFEAYRMADMQLSADQFESDILKKVRIFHTTCFGLSREPARSHILDAAARAQHFNVQLSIDLNYAEKIWRDRKEAQETVRSICGLGALVKLSEVDWIRLYESPFSSPEEATGHFLRLGATQVCLTLGSEGCVAATRQETLHLPAKQVDVEDATGAEDAFWSGYLTAWLDGRGLRACAEAGMRMAAFKMSQFGNLPSRIDRQLIYSS